MTNKKRDTLLSKVKNIKLKNAGKKIKLTRERPQLSKSESKIDYPNLYLNVDQVPDLKGYEAGDDCTLLVKATIRSHSLNENEKEPKRESFDLEVKKIGFLNK